MPKKVIFLIVIVLLVLSAHDFEGFSATEPAGDPRAVKGGLLTLNTSEFPKSFNYYINNTADALAVFGLVYESLLEIDPNTLEYHSLLAKSWSISADKKVFTFGLDPAAKWADGKPVTADDVLFTYKTIMDPKNLTSVQRLFLSRFQAPEAVNSGTVRFTAKNVHYNNLVTLAGLNILPKHLFQGKDFNKAFNMALPAGSGPYRLSEVKLGRYYVLTRNPKYWAAKLPHHRGMYNFNQIKYKVISDNAAFEAFKKGDFDIFSGITAKRWVTETSSKPFQYNWVVKQKVYNYSPQGFQGLAFNLRRPLFKDQRIRMGISQLIDRKTLLEKIMYNEYQPLTSYWPSLYGTGKANPLIEYNPARAKELFKAAGYTALDKQGFLVNSKGERLEFTVSYQGESFERHLTLIKEDCRKAGVNVKLELLSWPTLLKKMDEFNFDTVVVAWSSNLFPDPEQLWHSKHASEPGGSNLPGYRDPEVDRLIDSLPPVFDAAKRDQIIKKIDGIIYRDVPYALFWGANYERILYKNVFGMPKTIFPKYADASSIIAYWWLDPAKVKRYREAVKRNQRLPGAPVEVYYDKSASK
jgi:microcin C transport system substrate-binding protein